MEKVHPNDNSDVCIYDQISTKMVLPVFKFMTGFYLKIMQRSANKQCIPRMVNYIKAYMNSTVDCAKWFI
jgi:hypothetical protein